jgi:hypothetical protein
VNLAFSARIGYNSLINTFLLNESRRCYVEAHACFPDCRDRLPAASLRRDRPAAAARRLSDAEGQHTLAQKGSAAVLAFTLLYAIVASFAGSAQVAGVLLQIRLPRQFAFIELEEPCRSLVRATVGSSMGNIRPALRGRRETTPTSDDRVAHEDVFKWRGHGRCRTTSGRRNSSGLIADQPALARELAIYDATRAHPASRIHYPPAWPRS